PHDNAILERKIERHFHVLLACQRIGERGSSATTRALLGWIAKSHEMMLSASLKLLTKMGRRPRYAQLMRAAVHLENAIRAWEGWELEGRARSLEGLIRFCPRSLARHGLCADVMRLLDADLTELRDELANVGRVRPEDAVCVAA